MSVTCIDVGEHVKFANRVAAGRALAPLLSSYKGKPSVIVGLVRGGVVVAYTLAHDLSLPFDILVVKKLSSPMNRELAIGALAPDNILYIDHKLAVQVGATDEYVNREIVERSHEIEEKTVLYRKNKVPTDISGKTVILVDDGIATGATIVAAIRWCRQQKVLSVVVAVPVAPKEIIATLATQVDELIVAEKPEYFDAVGQFYRNFEQVTDDEVIRLLHGGNRNIKI